MSKKAPRLLALLVVVGWSASRAGTAQPIIAIDTPSPGQTVSGVVRVSGFVLDMNRIDRVELFLDGGSTLINRADLNIPRADVLASFPNYANSPNGQPGFLTSFLARNLLDGPHSLTLVVTEEGTGAQTTSGPRNFFVDNAVNQPPFGYIDIPAAGITEGANGSFPVAGWALDDSDVDHIDFLVDGQIVAGAVGRGLPGSAVFGSTRPDVFAAFPDFPEPLPRSLYSGFLANVDTTDLLNGLHQFSVRVTDDQGASSVIGSRTVQVINNGSNLAPFGVIDVPLDKATLLCQNPGSLPPPGGGCPSPCFPQPPSQACGARPVSFYNNIVQGWALDVGARLDRGQVAYVELLLDGVVIANTRRDCVVLSGARMNCYGVNRPDVAQFYSGYVNADNAGFFFGFAVQPNLSTGFNDIFIPSECLPVMSTVSGKHTLAVRVGDEEETVIQIGAMSLDILCDVSVSPDHATFGFIDTPGYYQFINGNFLVTGWAHDFDGGVSRLDVDIDGQVVATLTALAGTYGIRRDDVPANDIRVSTPFVGFQYLLDTSALPDSEHDLVIYGFDAGGRRTEVGRRKFVVLNNTETRQ